MPFYFRKLRLTKWVDCIGPYNDLASVPADPISDFQTKKNDLSLWLVHDDRSNLGRVIAAFSTTQSQIERMEFALIPNESIRESGLEVAQTDGISLDMEANTAFHFDLRRLTGMKLVELARIIVNADSIQEFWAEEEVLAALRESVAKGFVDPAKLNKGLTRRLN